MTTSASETAWKWDLSTDHYPYWDEDLASGFEPDDVESSLTYGGFLFVLQDLGIQLYSLLIPQFGMLIGKGTYFSVYRHEVNPMNFRSLILVISKPSTPLFKRPPPPMNTYVAFKRMRIRNDAFGVEISDQGQLHAICREIQSLTHPKLRDHDSIIKLQAIIWENGFGVGNENDLPMWPTLVLEYCETTLADYQLDNIPLPLGTKMRLSALIGGGVGALHSAKINHGDLKSENVLLKIRDQGLLEPKLADFGCSVNFEKTNGKKRYWVGGSEMWCAPEVSRLFQMGSC